MSETNQKMMDVNPKKRKSIVKKSINRKISTGNFENVDINVEIQEEIEWSTLDERMKKTQDVSKILIIDFCKTLNSVADSLKINKTTATIETTNKKKSAEKSAEKSDVNIGDDLFS